MKKSLKLNFDFLTAEKSIDKPPSPVQQQDPVNDIQSSSEEESVEV